MKMIQRVLTAFSVSILMQSTLVLAQGSDPTAARVTVTRVEQSGQLPVGLARPDVHVLANEPQGGSCALVLDFDLESVPQTSTPRATLNLGELEKAKVSRPGQSPGTGRGALHVMVLGGSNQPPQLAGSFCVKPAGVPTFYSIDVTDAVRNVLAMPAGQRKIRLEVRMTGKPSYYEVYALLAGEGKHTPALEISPADNWTNDWEQRLTPITCGPLVYREACLPLAASRDADLTLQLLYPAKKIVEVIHLGTGQTLQEGRDWVLRDGELVLPPGSHAPIQIESEFFIKEPNSATAPAENAAPQKVSVKLMEGTWYHQRQLEVTYEPAQRDWLFPKPVSSLNDLPRTKRLLSEKSPMRVLIFGDSISLGGNASRFQGAWPYQSPFGELVVWKLREHYGNEIVVMNHSRGGSTSAFGTTQASSQVGWFKPDLVILGFGMNDRAENRRVDYKQNLEKIIDTIRQDSPQTEFVLVTSMLNNPKQPTGLEPVQHLRDQALSLSRPGLAFADITTTHLELCKRKAYLDTSGNGANHPNDYLHRIYAQRILEILIPGQ